MPCNAMQVRSESVRHWQHGNSFPPISLILSLLFPSTFLLQCCKCRLVQCLTGAAYLTGLTTLPAAKPCGQKLECREKLNPDTNIRTQPLYLEIQFGPLEGEKRGKNPNRLTIITVPAGATTSPSRRYYPLQPLAHSTAADNQCIPDA